MAPSVLTRHDFTEEVASGTVLVYFWAAWSAPCKAQSGLIDALCERRRAVKVCKVNIDEQLELAVRWQITNIPTLLVFRDGKPVRRAVGLLEDDQLDRLLSPFPAE